MSRHPRPTVATAPVLRAIGAIALGLAFCPLLMRAAPSLADEPIVRDNRDPDFRIQVVVEEIVVNVDGDAVGSGELRVLAILTRCGESTCRGFPGSELLDSRLEFSADSGDRLNPNWTFPRAGDGMDGGTTERTGIPLHSGTRYVLRWQVSEDDGWSPFRNYDSPIGDSLEITAENGWQLGKHHSLAGTGDHSQVRVQYEIRPAPLADLVPTNIGIVDLGNDQLHCVTVDNLGRRPPDDTSSLSVYADRQLVATFDVPVLGVGQTTQRCIARSNLPGEEHVLTFRADEADAIAEINERNNTYQHRIPALQSVRSVQQQPVIGTDSRVAGAGANDTATTAPAAVTSPDLVPKALRVGGDKSTGPSDCRAGRNVVTVMIKNEGTTTATAFNIRLEVDDDNAALRTVPGLEAGREESVQFDGFQMKEGERKLTATIDPQKLVGELREDNNELRISVRCRNEGNDNLSGPD